MRNDSYSRAMRSDAIYLCVCLFTLCVLAYSTATVYELEQSIPRTTDSNEEIYSPEIVSIVAPTGLMDISYSTDLLGSADADIESSHNASSATNDSM